MTHMCLNLRYDLKMLLWYISTAMLYLQCITALQGSMHLWTSVINLLRRCGQTSRRKPCTCSTLHRCHRYHHRHHHFHHHQYHHHRPTTGKNIVSPPPQTLYGKFIQNNWKVKPQVAPRTHSTTGPPPLPIDVEKENILILLRYILHLHWVIWFMLYEQ